VLNAASVSGGTSTRASGSLGLKAHGPLRTAIRLALRTPLGPACTPTSLELTRGEGELQAGPTEYDDGPRFARRLGGAFSCADLEGRKVLDLGCGYGGRTMYYADVCRARKVVGLEITEAMVERCRAFAAARGTENVTFLVGRAESLPFEAATFEAVISFDVLEHVNDPASALSEIARVLTPEGRAWLVFPSYLGARSSHLDYVTRLPALHRIFDPRVIVDVVNDFLEREPARFSTAPQPPPQRSSLGRVTLPGLNGLCWRDVDQLLGDASLVRTTTVLQGLVTPDTPVPAAAAAATLFQAAGRLLRWPELLIGSIGLCVERRRP
jgi:SAM-dependent methyltransferase